MNVKSIADQLGERGASFALSSDSAEPLADDWSVSDFVALSKPRVMMLADWVSRWASRRCRSGPPTHHCFGRAVFLSV